MNIVYNKSYKKTELTIPVYTVLQQLMVSQLKFQKLKETILFFFAITFSLY